MKTKEAFHKLIDKIEDEKTLRRYFELIKTLNNNETGKLWDSLTQEQKEELLISYDESFDPRNLISHEEVKTRHGKWLKK